MTTARKKKELIDNLIKAEIVKTVFSLIKNDQPVTMDEIAKRCGVAKGTLYNYFENKKALLNYVHQTVLIPIRKRNKTIFESTKAPLVKLNEFIDLVFDIMEELSLYFHFVQHHKTVAEEIGERLDLVIRPLVKVCTQGIQDGAFIDVNPYLLAEMIYGTVFGPVKSMQHRFTEKQDIKKIKQDIICLVDRIILK